MDIGVLIFPRMDQIDFTGPFEVFSRLPNTAVHVIAKELHPIRDIQGLILTPERTLADAPPLHLLHVPGGPGQQDLMEDEAVLSFIREHANAGRMVYSVCTGALVCGAAGILRGKRATTHWASLDFLPYFGAIPVDSRVVVDGNLVSAAGVTAGIDGALTVAAQLCGREVAEEIQLAIEYAPEPPFQSGSPRTAPAPVLDAVTERYGPIREARSATARKIAIQLGIELPAPASGSF